MAHPLAVAAGFFCPKATSKPIRCRAGTYCPRESAAETPCEAGTYNRQTAWVMFDGQQYQSGGTSEADCFDCPKVRPLPTQDTIKALSPQIYHVVLIENTPGQGHYCEEGSKGPKQCPRGTYGNEPNLGACADCEAGSFQGDLGQMACAPCLPGGYCEEGAAAPIPCMASTYSSATGLSSSKECETCPGACSHATHRDHHHQHVLTLLLCPILGSGLLLRGGSHATYTLPSRQGGHGTWSGCRDVLCYVQG